MRRDGLRLGLATLAAMLCLGAAADPADRLADPAKEARARAIFREVRCLVCQNESIDDSQAELAGDLRKLVREEIAAGRTDVEVRGHLVSRYGEFVLLKPAFSWGNAALWGAPVLVVVGGVALMAGQLRRRRPEPELTAAEETRLSHLAEHDGA